MGIFISRNVQMKFTSIKLIAGLAFILLTSLAAVAFPESATNAIELEANADAMGRPLVHFWSECVGAGRANEGLRASWLEQLKLVHEQCGFQYVRFHGLFHSDMFVYHETTNGTPVYNWQYVDDLYDRMLALGVRPFVELSFNPIDPLPKNWTGWSWWRANASPPLDNAKWAALVDHFARHCIARYGIDEVRQWYFEVWNEPSLKDFFYGGTRAQYFELYKTTALALKNVDSQLRVGGPATSNFRPNLPRGTKIAAVDHEPTPEDEETLNWQPVWVEDFLAFCHSNNVPVDFISTHPYPRHPYYMENLATGQKVRVLGSVDATKHDLTLLRKMVDDSPYPNAQIQLTEWSSSPNSRDFTHDCLPAATFIAKANLDSSGLVNGLSYWTFTDVFEELGAGNTIFYGGFGLVNYQGIVKPAFHAYQFLNALGNETLARTDGAIITRHGDTGKLTGLAYLYPPQVKISPPVSTSLADAEAMMTNGTPEPLKMVLNRLPPNARIQVETLDRTHGNAVAAWEAIGKPEPPTREQTAVLRRDAEAVKTEIFHADPSGRFVLERPIEPWSLVLIQQL
jgi:xylan 1,4-beta-xylosidase